MDKVFFFCVNFDRQSRGNSDVNCVDVGGVTIENLVTSGVQAHGFSYSGVRPVIIAGHTPENLGFRTQFQLPVGTSTLGGRPGDFDKSFVHCKLCLDASNKKKGQAKYCGGTTNLVQHLKSWHNQR